MAVVLVAVLLAFASTALAGTTNVGSETQVTPGTTQRTIWGENQVYIYRLPTGVNHAGYIHVEVTWNPTWADCDIYLLDSDFDAVNMEEGYNASFEGKEVIDYKVETITNQTIAHPEYDDDYMVGDAYYVLVYPFGDRSTFKIWGYYPQIDPTAGYGWAVKNAWNYWLYEFSKGPKTISGAPYGGLFDFTPTSLGSVGANLEWPANVEDKTVGSDILEGLTPANFEQYMYAGSAWDEAFGTYGFGNWYPKTYNAGTDDEWAGLSNSRTLKKSGTSFTPLKAYHYVPGLWEVAADSAYGPYVEYDSLGAITAGGLKLGVQKMGYKATITYPQNLRLVSATKSAHRGQTITLRGTYADSGAWMPAGTPVKIQKKTASGAWKDVKTVKVAGDLGKWTARIKATKTTIWRAISAQAPTANVTISDGASIDETVDVYVGSALPSTGDAVFEVSNISKGYKITLVSVADNVAHAMTEGQSDPITVGDSTYTVTINGVTWIEQSVSKRTRVYR